MENIQEHITFTGRVQGVGFRYHAKYLAQHYGVIGWIQNNYDSSVEVLLT